MTAAAKLRTIRRWSLGMSLACMGLILALLGATFAYWLRLDAAGWAAQLGLRAAYLGALERAVSLPVLLAPAVAMTYGLWRLRAAFQRFAAGEVFSVRAAQGLRGFAAGAAVSALLACLAFPALTWLFTARLPGGPHTGVQIGTGALTLLLMAGLVWVFAHVLAGAASLAEENAVLAEQQRALADENAQFV